MERIGLAIGKATHTVVKGKMRSYIANSEAGANRLCKRLAKNAATELVLCGNRRWATPIAYWFDAHGISVLYFTVKTEPGKRGKAGNMAELLAHAFASGVQPRPFFQKEEPKRVSSPLEQDIYPVVRMAHEYLAASSGKSKASPSNI